MYSLSIADSKGNGINYQSIGSRGFRNRDILRSPNSTGTGFIRRGLVSNV